MKTLHKLYPHCFNTALILSLGSSVFGPTASAGILDDVGDIVKGGARTVERTYQSATQPVRDAADSAYRKTIRSPFHDVKNTIRKVVPEKVRFAYKEHVEQRFKPVIGWHVDVYGKGQFIDGTDRLVNSYIDQFKEMAVTPELYAIYSAAQIAADPMPQHMVARIEEHWSDLSPRDLHKDARFLVSSELVATLTNGSAKAVTIYDVIVFREPLDDSYKSIALLAHELVHVAQFNKYTWAEFARRYYVEGKLTFDRRNPLEREAYKLEDAMLDRLTPNRPTRTYGHDQRVATSSQRAIAQLAAMQASDVPLNVALASSMSDAMNRRDDESAKIIMAYALAGDDVTKEATVQMLHMAASMGRPVFSNRERLQYAQLAAAMAPNDEANWYHLAATAYQLRDAESEFNALCRLAQLVIERDYNQQNTNQGRWTQNAVMAKNYLDRAIYLSNVISWQRRGYFDRRVPFLLLLSLTMYMQPNFQNDDLILQLCNPALQEASRVRPPDRLNFVTLDLVTRAYFRVGTVRRDRRLMSECQRLCGRAIQEYDIFGNRVDGLSNDYRATMQKRLNDARI